MIIPCYNEDPALLARVLESCRWQTRQPYAVVVTDDGSTVSNAEVQAACPDVIWLRTVNRGKKHAQSEGFREVPWADIFLAIDSDSALERRAIEEGLKPFAYPRVQSVAAVEMALNWRKNILTRATAARSLAFQLFAMSSQSVAGGSVPICPGAASFYRASLIWKVLPSYLGGTFCGQPCILGDDTMLTFFALMNGRAIQQPTAFCFPAYPETLSHHLRQWVRWMRASTIRQIWRLRYLPFRSYGCWFSVWQLGAFTAGVAATALIVIAWSASESLAVGALGGLFACRSCWVSGCSLSSVLTRVSSACLSGCARQKWVTREQVEVHLEKEMVSV